LAVQLAAAVTIMVLAGCSTSPCADFLDCVCPGRFPDAPKGVVGGVCIPQGGQVGGAIGAPPGLPGQTGPFGPPGVQPLPPPAPIGSIPPPPPPPGPWK